MEKRKCLAFILCLTLCYSLFQLTARAQSPSHSISSQGNITYGSGPSSPPSERLLGTDMMYWFGDTDLSALIDLAKSVGIDYWRQHVICGDTDWWLNQMLTVKQLLDQRGIKLIVGGMGYDGWDTTFISAFPSKREGCAALIMNTDGWGDKWIERYGRMVEVLQPWAINVVNEMFDKTGTPYQYTMTDAQYLEYYRQFCIRAIDAWRAIKPDLVCIISGCPFSDNRPIANNPIPRPNLVYSFHYYYLRTGELRSNPAAWEVAYYEGRLSEAKSLLHDFLMNGKGALSTLKAKGLPILFEEFGTWAEERYNNYQFIRDAWEICAENDVGIGQFCFARFGTGTPHQSWWGLLTSDWKQLNSYGQVWASCMARYE
jgi:hypothetical protein